MNRPIKFRAWDKAKQKIFYAGYIGFHGSIWEQAGVNSPELEMRDWELMQFTGLLDKNGKEIYEGDILVFGKTPHHPGNGNFKVYWDTEKAMFHVERFPKEKFMTPDLRQENCTHYEVIGNIYENAELLNK